MDVILRTMIITRVRDMKDRTSPAEDRMFANWRTLRGVSSPKNVGPEMKEAIQLRIKKKGRRCRIRWAAGVMVMTGSPCGKVAGPVDGCTK